MQTAPTPTNTERDSADARVFEAVVFERVNATPDFEQSQAIVLPGSHSAENAWAAVFAALRRNAGLIGGEIRPPTS